MEKRSKHGLRRVLWLLMVALVMGAAWSVLSSNGFRLQSITVTGNQNLAPAEVIRAADVAPGDLRWLLPGNLINKRLESEPWVAHATATWGPQGKLAIQVVERHPLALLRYHGTYLELDREGRVLDQIGRTPVVGLPVLTMGDYPADGVLRGEVLTDPMLHGALEMLGYLPSSALARIGEVTVQGSSLTAYLSLPRAFTVQIGPPQQLKVKMAWLVNSLDQLEADQHAQTPQYGNVTGINLVGDQPAYMMRN